jgi:hypothetical protein
MVTECGSVEIIEAEQVSTITSHTADVAMTGSRLCTARARALEPERPAIARSIAATAAVFWP